MRASYDTIEEDCIFNIFQQQLINIIATLPPREQEVLKMRFGLKSNYSLTLEEVAKHFDVTRERIRQMESKALRRLRNPKLSGVLRGYSD